MNEDDISIRLHRVRGQIEGIEQMIGQNQDCSLVIHQIMAARSALGSVAVKLLTKASCTASTLQEQKNFKN